MKGYVNMKSILTNILFVTVGFIIGYLIFTSSKFNDSRLSDLQKSIDIKQEIILKYTDSINDIKIKTDSLEFKYKYSDSLLTLLDKKIDSLEKEVKDTSNIEKIRQEYEKITDIDKLSTTERVKFFTEYFK